MKRRVASRHAALAAVTLVAGCVGADQAEWSSDDLQDGAGAEEIELGQLGEAIVRGQTEHGRNYVMNLRIAYQSVNLSTGEQNVGFCSSVLFAPRVLLTAAHCINPIRNAGTPDEFVDSPSSVMAYIGNNFNADLAALGPNPLDAISAPPAASRFMRADSWETHPSWDLDTLFPDLAAVYLDRQPRLPPNNTIVDPLPIGRNRLGAANVGQLMTIVGYGASRSLNAQGTQLEGTGVKRRGTSPFVGAPVISPLPPDPHPGILFPNVRNGLMQLNGKAPNANACSGDSGGPAIRNVNGQDYVFGISSWGGNFCEDFSYYTRLDPFLPFVDESYRKGGQAPIIPRLECIAPRPAGGFRAYYGYTNQNGVLVSVPYGNSNAFARDTQNARPTRFEPGNHGFEFGVNFTAGQTLSWKLSPPNSPTTTLNATSQSPRCAADNRGFVCAQACEATVAAGCGETYSECLDGCFQFYQDIPGCDPQLDAYHRCVAQTPASGFECFDGFSFALECGPVLDEGLAECLGG
jgi:hypothetical protein